MIPRHYYRSLPTSPNPVPVVVSDRAVDGLVCVQRGERCEYYKPADVHHVTDFYDGAGIAYVVGNVP